MPVFGSLDDLKPLVGQEIAASDWLPVTQDTINEFAQATGDRQWIHVDAERARRESPFGVTIAHGFLTLSLLSQLHLQTVQFTRINGVDVQHQPKPALVAEWILRHYPE